MIAFKLRQTYLIKLETGKRIRYHRLEFGRHFVRTYGNCLHLGIYHINSGPFYVYGNAIQQALSMILYYNAPSHTDHPPYLYNVIESA